MPRVVAERPDALPMLAEVFREHGYEGASLLVSTLVGEVFLGAGQTGQIPHNRNRTLISPWRDECRKSHRGSCFGRLVLESELCAAEAT